MCPKARTRYFRIQPVAGSSRKRASSPSLVSSNNPSVLMSSRPIDTTRGSWERSLPNTVGRPSGSWFETTSPPGLWYRQSLVASFCGSGWPSIRITSLSVTLVAAEVSTLPFIFTRPSPISRSASRLEQMPARAITLAMRSPSNSLILTRHP